MHYQCIKLGSTESTSIWQNMRQAVTKSLYKVTVAYAPRISLPSAPGAILCMVKHWSKILLQNTDWGLNSAKHLSQWSPTFLVSQAPDEPRRTMAADKHPPKFRRQVATSICHRKVASSRSVAAENWRRRLWMTQLVGGILADAHPQASMREHLDAPAAPWHPIGDPWFKHMQKSIPIQQNI